MLTSSDKIFKSSLCKMRLFSTRSVRIEILLPLKIKKSRFRFTSLLCNAENYFFLSNNTRTKRILIFFLINNTYYTNNTNNHNLCHAIQYYRFQINLFFPSWEISHLAWEISHPSFSLHTGSKLGISVG
jgi:hypothetical protein